VITLSQRAKRDVAALIRDFNRNRRPEAIHNLLTAIHQATQQIGGDAAGGLGAPRPYPGVARPGRECHSSQGM